MPATQKQIDYIEILFIDVGLDTKIKRMDFVSNLLGWEVPFLDEIAIPEASQVIEHLKSMKKDPYQHSSNCAINDGFGCDCEEC